MTMTAEQDEALHWLGFHIEFQPDVMEMLGLNGVREKLIELELSKQ